MSEESEKYIRDFIKGQETPGTASGYLSGYPMPASKQSQEKAKSFNAFIYLVPFFLMALAVLFLSSTITQRLITVALMVVIGGIGYRVTRKIRIK